MALSTTEVSSSLSDGLNLRRHSPMAATMQRVSCTMAHIPTQLSVACDKQISTFRRRSPSDFNASWRFVSPSPDLAIRGAGHAGDRNSTLCHLRVIEQVRYRDSLLAQRQMPSALPTQETVGARRIRTPLAQENPSYLPKQAEICLTHLQSALGLL